MKPHKIEVWKSVVTGLWHWNARSRNGRTIANGCEGYARRGTAVRMMEGVTDAKRRHIPVNVTGTNGDTERLY